jgi:hypothetical protein
MREGPERKKTKEEEKISLHNLGFGYRVVAG